MVTCFQNKNEALFSGEQAPLFRFYMIVCLIAVEKLSWQSCSCLNALRTGLVFVMSNKSSYLDNSGNRSHPE